MTNYEKSLEIKTYYVVEDNRGGMDTFQTYHASADEAIREAKSQWDHLTAQEQSKATIKAWSIIQDAIQDDLVDEDAPWWMAAADRQDLLAEYHA